MKYAIPQGMYQLGITQTVLESFFDGPFNKVISVFGIKEAKGKFDTDNIVYDGYDMPYHIHVLQGLLPALQIFEQILIQENCEDDEQVDTWFRVFCLGFLLHDANKLLEGYSLLHAINAIVDNTDRWHEKLAIYHFFPSVNQYWGDIQYVALKAENRTELGASLRSQQLPKTVKEWLSILVRFADKMASMGGAIQYKKQGEQLIPTKSYADGYQNIRQMYMHIKELIADLSISLPLQYVCIQENPYKMLTKQALTGIFKVLQINGRQILGVTHNSVLFFGEAFNPTLKQKAIESAINEEEIDVVQLSKIDFQTANLDFVNAKPLDEITWEKLMDNTADKFLSIAPNSANSYENNGFEMLKQLLETFEEHEWVSYIEDEKSHKIRLFFTNLKTEEALLFRDIVCLKKLKWLNAKKVKEWETDCDTYFNKEDAIYEGFKWHVSDTVLQSPKEIVNYFQTITKSPINLLKTLFSISYALNILHEDNIVDDPQEIKELLLAEVMDKLNPVEVSSTIQSSPILELMNHFLYYTGNLEPLWGRNLHIPIAEKRCAITNSVATKKYEETKAFGLKARGFSRKAPSYLTTSPKTKIGDSMIVENQIRKKYFSKNTEANLAIYRDFCEWGFGLPLQTILLKDIAVSRGIEIDDSLQTINVDKGASLSQDYHEYELIEIGKDIASQFYFISKNLRIAQALGIRMYVTSIMAHYRPHKAIFYYENAPRFAHQLNWHEVRLSEIKVVNHEIRLLIQLAKVGKNINSGYVLSYAGDRNHIFRLYRDYVKRVEIKEKQVKASFLKSQIRKDINELIVLRPKYFENMSIIKELANIALSIQRDNKNASQDSRMIRIALNALRQAIHDKADEEESIEIIAGMLFQNYRLKEFVSLNHLRTASRDFATKLYTGIYQEKWQKQLPAKTKEKILIAQFAFVYSEKVVQYFEEKKKA
ncbi:hypothetical protein [Chondrinema litorale]|uniref:hypothetical protein n=1 Tax=Chondrinema litorale TaxID=2994555 RepID=UPI00254379BA|nr:hypothetical protein [Chondrinema litorale]UZR99842.1 hypothetical protein OQ292_38295 [Chondrinema litorale]